jgi:formamidopyrimidine-DNA glycosylase
MPELPEVQTLADQLSKEILGKKIVAVEVLDSRIGNTAPEKIKQALADQSVIAVRRRAKNLIFYFTGEWAAVVHLMISGRIYLIGRATALPKGCMLKIDFEGEGSLCFCYLHLGYFELFPSKNVLEEPHLKPLGPETLGIGYELLKARISESKSSIKAALLNQKIVAGLGNIYVDEVLNESKISPLRKANRLKASEIKALHLSIQKTLKKAIDLRGTTIVSWSDIYGENGQYQPNLRVVGKEGGLCPNCNHLVKKGKVAGRTTYFCSNCQI